MELSELLISMLVQNALMTTLKLSDNTPTAHSAAVVGVDEDVEQPSQQAT